MEQLSHKLNAPFVSELWNAISKYPEANWNDALSKGQIASKLWLVEQINKVYGNKDFSYVYILAGWYGLLAALWLDVGVVPKIGKFRSFDVDPSCEKIADTINRKWVINDWKFKASTVDIYRINYRDNHYDVTNSKGKLIRLIDKPDLIINTSCEHLARFTDWYNMIPDGMPLVLQSNNYFSIEDHHSCVNSIEEFKKMAPMKAFLYEGELEFSEYKRFMLIGHK